MFRDPVAVRWNPWLPKSRLWQQEDGEGWEEKVGGENEQRQREQELLS